MWDSWSKLLTEKLDETFDSHTLCTVFAHLLVVYQHLSKWWHISAKWSQIFTKSSAYLRSGLLSWLKVFVRVHVPACTHRTWKHARNFGQKTNPHTSSKWSRIFTKSSVYLRIGLLSWLKVFVRVHVRACTHRTWKRARNFGQKTNPHISSKWSWIFMKLGMMLEEVSRKHQKKIGTNTCTHVHATRVNVRAHFYIW